MVNKRQDIKIINPDGNLSIREVLTIVFYFRKPNLDIVQNIQRAILGFVNLISIKALPEYYNYDGEQEDLNETSLQDLLYERLLSEKIWPNANIELIGDGIYAPEYYLWYNGKALDIEGQETEAGYLWCWMPRSFYIDNASQVTDYISTLALDLPFNSGYVSLGLAGENNYGKQALAKRYPGLDISHPGCVSADIGNKACGSYWQTFLDQDLCKTLGGVASIRAALPNDIEVNDLQSGKCQIILSSEPEIGDVNRQDILPKNRVFAKFLDDHGLLHVPERVVYFVDEGKMADNVTQTEWHQRFID